MGDEFDNDTIPVRERETRNHRPSSPYYQRCIENSNLHLVADRQAAIRLPRDELENRYISLNDENFLLKKSLNEQSKMLKKLQVQVQRLQGGGKKRVGSPPGHLNEDRIKKLEEIKKLLEGKVSVLKHQLQAHSRLHAQVHRNFASRPNSRKECRSSTPGVMYSSFINEFNSRMYCSPNPESEYNQRPATSYGERRDNLRNSRDITGGCTQYLDLDSEDEIISHHLDGCNPLEEVQEPDDCEDNITKVAENIELIRLKRLLKRQAAQLAAMTAHTEIAEKEITALRNDCQVIANDSDNMKKMLNFERQKVQSMLREINHVSTLKQDIRMLEEQVRDLKQERLQLKDHNEQLLKLAAHKYDESDAQAELYEKQLNSCIGDLGKQMMLSLSVSSELDGPGDSDESCVGPCSPPGIEENL